MKFGIALDFLITSIHNCWPPFDFCLECANSVNGISNASAYLVQLYWTLFASDIDECLSQPCQNNGTCSNNVDHFICHCHSGSVGYMCQVGRCFRRVFVIISQWYEWSAGLPFFSRAPIYESYYHNDGLSILHISKEAIVTYWLSQDQWFFMNKDRYSESVKLSYI